MGAGLLLWRPFAVRHSGLDLFRAYGYRSGLAHSFNHEILGHRVARYLSALLCPDAHPLFHGARVVNLTFVGVDGLDLFADGLRDIDEEIRVIRARIKQRVRVVGLDACPRGGQ